MGGAVALRAEALKEGLPDFYAQAVLDAEVDPIAPPEIDITSGEESGAVTFDAVVQVRPTVAIPGYPGLQVTVPGWRSPTRSRRPGAPAPRERGRAGRRRPPGRRRRPRHVDIHGTGERRGGRSGSDDFLYEVGSGSVVPEIGRPSSSGGHPGAGAGLPGDPPAASGLPGPGRRTSGARCCPRPPTSGRPRARSSPRWRRCVTTSGPGWPGSRW